MPYSRLNASFWSATDEVPAVPGYPSDAQVEGRMPNMPADDAVGLSPLSRQATHRSNADMPVNIEVGDGAAATGAGLAAVLRCALAWTLWLALAAGCLPAWFRAAAWALSAGFAALWCADARRSGRL